MYQHTTDVEACAAPFSVGDECLKLCKHGPWLKRGGPGEEVRAFVLGPQRRNAPRRRARLERRTPLRRLTPLRRTAVSPASEAQRAKVAGRGCLVCGRRPVDPAHLVPRSVGGCDEPDCCVPLCRAHHRAYDRGELDLLPHLEPGHRAELAHALAHLSLLGLLRRVTGVRWAAVADGRGTALPERGLR